MVMLLVCAGRGLSRQDLADRIFYGMVWATIALCVLEATSFCIDGCCFPGSRELNIALNTLLYSINIVFVFLWTVYVDYRVFGDIDRIKQRACWLALPSAAVLALIVVNLFVPLIFSVSQENVYARGPLVMVPYGVSLLYLAYSMALVYRDRKHDRSFMFLPSVIFILPLLAGCLVQMAFYGLSVTWAALSISMISVYLNVQNKLTSIDPLSGAFNRQYLYSYINRQIKRGHALGGVMIDMDRFKQINDSFGHLMGDQAIVAMGKIMQSCMQPGDVVSRYGGDEFIVVGLLPEDGEPVDFAARIDAEVDRFNRTTAMPFRLSCSYGSAVLNPETDSLDDFLRNMDASMYRNKRANARKYSDRRHR